MIKVLWMLALFLNFVIGMMWTWMPSTRPEGMSIGSTHIYALITFVALAFYLKEDKVHA